MRGYFHRLGYWGFNFSSDFITFFVCILHKFAYSQIIQDGLWVSDSGHYLTTGFSRLFTFNPHASEPTIFLYQVRNVLFFSCSVDWKLRWLSFLSVLSVFVDFPFWMRLGVRYHCYYLYSVVCQQIWRNVLPLFFPRYTGVKKTQHYTPFISNPIVLFWRTKKKKPTAT